MAKRKSNVVPIRKAWEPGLGPSTAGECADILLECTQLNKLVRVSQSKCHQWVLDTGEHVGHPDGTKHLKQSITTGEAKCSLTLSEVTQLLVDCGATTKLVKVVCETLRERGVGAVVERPARWIWVKNEGSQSKSK